jgi:hypothetical protein
MRHRILHTQCLDTLPGCGIGLFVIRIGLQFHQRKARCQRRTQQTISGKSRLPTMHRARVFPWVCNMGLPWIRWDKSFVGVRANKANWDKGNIWHVRHWRKGVLTYRKSRVVQLTANPKHIERICT